MLGGCFYSSDKFRLLNQPFLTRFFISFKKHYCLELQFKKFFLFTWYHFLYYNDGWKTAILANLGKLKRDTFRAINALAEIHSVLEIVLTCYNWFFTRSKIHHLVLYMACWGKNFLLFYFIQLFLVILLHRP